MLKDIRKRQDEANSRFSQFCEKRLKTLVIGYVSNKTMLQFETCKKYLTNATWLKHVDFTIMHRDRHTTRQIINLLNPELNLIC